MKKLIIILTVVTVSLSGCLKDKPNVDFSKIFPTINLPYSGQPYFGKDAVTDATDTITKSFTINLASDYPLTKDTKVTVGVDTSLIAPYNASNSAVVYNSMPAAAYVFPQATVTIKAGTRLATLNVTFIKHFLDPSKSYMLPIRVLSADQAISANFSTHYYHIIGNDFAGTYTYEYTRYNNATGTPPFLLDNISTGVLSPITPTEFQMTTGYNGQGVRYDVKFTRTVTGSVVSYSNFVVTFVPADVTGIWAPAGISVTQAPVFFSPPFDPAGPLTYAQAVQIFRFQYVAFNGVSSRYLIDYYHK
jgi:hypothetical protein